MYKQNQFSILDQAKTTLNRKTITVDGQKSNNSKMSTDNKLNWIEHMKNPGLNVRKV